MEHDELCSKVAFEVLLPFTMEINLAGDFIWPFVSPRQGQWHVKVTWSRLSYFFLRKVLRYKVDIWTKHKIQEMCVSHRLICLGPSADTSMCSLFVQIYFTDADHARRIFKYLDILENFLRHLEARNIFWDCSFENWAIVCFILCHPLKLVIEDWWILAFSTRFNISNYLKYTSLHNL